MVLIRVEENPLLPHFRLSGTVVKCDNLISPLRAALATREMSMILRWQKPACPGKSPAPLKTVRGNCRAYRILPLRCVQPLLAIENSRFYMRLGYMVWLFFGECFLCVFIRRFIASGVTSYRLLCQRECSKIKRPRVNAGPGDVTSNLDVKNCT
jgi:hypothetical protein